MLWLSIHLPRLALEVFGADPDHELLAIVDGQQLIQATAGLKRAGVRPGMRIPAAQALCPQLILRERDARAERYRLKHLAAWGLQFTATVSMEPPETILLEIGGSLRYFGGLESLTARVRAGLQALGYHYRLGIAATPTAAWMLSVAGDERPVLPEHSLDRRLGPLPMALLVSTAQHHEALRGLGVETIADCLALPRAGLGRRLGQTLLERLDRALGRRPDPRRPYLPPTAFRSHIELPAEVEQAHQLGFALNRLLRELCGLLLGTGNGVQRLYVTLDHLRRQPTLFELGTLEPSRDPDHLMSLLRERLERVELPAPVIGLGLEARRLQRLEQRPMALLEADAGSGERHWNTLLERLSARLGEPRIRGLSSRAEHRPEQAWQYVPPGEGMAAGDCLERPLWLFPQPEHLGVQAGLPVWHGPLVLERGPECIESGWWDGGDISRDYYVAVNPAGARLWVFRERREPRRWFLHGLFG